MVSSSRVLWPCRLLSPPASLYPRPSSLLLIPCTLMPSFFLFLCPLLFLCLDSSAFGPCCGWDLVFRALKGPLLRSTLKTAPTCSVTFRLITLFDFLQGIHHSLIILYICFPVYCLFQTPFDCPHPEADIIAGPPPVASTSSSH